MKNKIEGIDSEEYYKIMRNQEKIDKYIDNPELIEGLPEEEKRIYRKILEESIGEEYKERKERLREIVKKEIKGYSIIQYKEEGETWYESIETITIEGINSANAIKVNEKSINIEDIKKIVIDNKDEYTYGYMEVEKSKGEYNKYRIGRIKEVETKEAKAQIGARYKTYKIEEDIEIIKETIKASKYSIALHKRVSNATLMNINNTKQIIKEYNKEGIYICRKM